MPGADDTTDLPLPSLETLVAGTLALMTSWADPAPDCRLSLDHQRSLLARKVVSNLFFLQHHPHASPALRQVMCNAHGRWMTVAASAHEPLGRSQGEYRSASARRLPDDAAPANESHCPQEGASAPRAAPNARTSHLH